MTRGTALRDALTAEYDVEGAPANAILDAICATSDELELLEAALAAEGVLLPGARGQRVANPALAAIARHRTVLARLLAQAFPDAHETTSEAASRAARTRWNREQRPA